MRSVVRKIGKLKRFLLDSFKLERSILSWKEPSEVGKLKMNLDITVLVGKEKSDVINNDCLTVA